MPTPYSQASDAREGNLNFMKKNYKKSWNNNKFSWVDLQLTIKNENVME